VVGANGVRGLQQTVAIGVVLALVVVACGSGDGGPAVTLVETTSPPDGGTGEGLVVPEPSALIIDEDPASPVAATVLYEPGDHLIEKVEYIGPKPSSNLPPTGALVYLVGFDEAIRIDSDSAGRPAVMYLGPLGELRFGFTDDVLNVQHVALDGTTSSENFPLAAGGDTASESLSDLGANGVVSEGSLSAGLFALARGPGAAVRPGTGHFARADEPGGSSIEVRRAAFFDVVVTSEELLPDGLQPPFAKTSACYTSRGETFFECRWWRQPLTSHDFGRTDRIVVAHQAEEFVEGLTPTLWPSLQACKEAFGNDWWAAPSPMDGWERAARVAEGAANVFSSTLATGIYYLLAAKAEEAVVLGGASVLGGGAAAVAVPELVAGLAAAATVAIFFWAGNAVGELVFGEEEPDCDKILRRVSNISRFAQSTQDAGFTIEVCVVVPPGWTVDADCKDVGPYLPFSDEMLIEPGNPDTLDRNRLPTVEFVMSPSPGVVSGRITDAESGDPVEGAGVVVVPSNLENMQTTSDGAGSFEITDVPAGPSLVVVNATGFNQATKEIQVQSEQATEVTITLEPVSYPWTFEGTGTRTLTASTNFGINGSVTDKSTVEIVIMLEDGGKATGTFTFHRELVYDCTQEEGRHGNVFARDREQEVVWEGTHEWEGTRDEGTFTLLPGSTAELTGSYNAATISGFQTQEYTIPAKDECDGTREDRRDLEFKDIPIQR